MRTCSIDGCSKPHYGRGLCSMHHSRWKRHGHLNPTRTSPGTCLAWVTAHATHTGDECLTWPFSRKRGYGQFGVDGKIVSAHRYMCTIAHGDPPTPQHVAAHSCGKGHEGCVNPQHLRWATTRDNHADRHKHGTTNSGETNGSAKLTNAQVAIIRQRMRNGETNVALAAELGMSVHAISNIRTGRTFKAVGAAA